MNNEEYIKQFADAVWSYILNKHLKNYLADSMCYYMATVTTAPSGGRIGVQRAFDNAITVPCAASAEGLSVGDPCMVLVFGDYTNQLVIGDPTKIANEERVIAKISDPDANPLSTTGGKVTPAIELGGIDRTTGAETTATDRVRSDDYIAVTDGEEYTIRNSADVQTCVMFYDSSYNFLTAWNGSNSYKWVASGSTITAPTNAAYMKFYTNLVSDTSTVFTVSWGEQTTVTFTKQYFSNPVGDYSIACEEIDTDDYKLEITRENDEFSIVTVRAPINDPKEATLSLSTNGTTPIQFADFSSLKYDGSNVKGHICIVCQARNSLPLPDFYVAFNDGSSGRVRKFLVEPDAMPIKLTSTGIAFRRNNTFDNNWTSADTVTVNVPDMYDDVEELKTRIHFATCSTAAETAAKVASTVNGDFELVTGAMVRVLFTNATTYNGVATLNVDGTGAVNISRVVGNNASRYFWSAGEAVDFVYDGTRFVMSRGSLATTTYYGLTKLSNSLTNTSTTLAATANTVKQLNDKITSLESRVSALEGN